MHGHVWGALCRRFILNRALEADDCLIVSRCDTIRGIKYTRQTSLGSYLVPLVLLSSSGQKDMDLGCREKVGWEWTPPIPTIPFPNDQKCIIFRVRIGFLA